MKNDKYNPDYFLNRELSWIEFNRRVLEEASDSSQPLLERVKFLSIFSTNLDEFFMIRVAGLKRHVNIGMDEESSDGYSAKELLIEIYSKLIPMVNLQHELFNNEIIPDLESNGIKFYTYEELNEIQKETIDNYFNNEIFPVLTPIALDNVHPFPNLVNRTLALAIVIDDPETEIVEEKVSVLQVPSNFPRFHKIDDDENYILVEDIIKANAFKLFPGMKILGSYSFRITRNADLELEEDEADDLLTLIKEEVKKRRLGIIVRLEVDDLIPDDVLDYILSFLKLNKNDIYRCKGMLYLGDLMSLYKIDKRKLKYEGFIPRVATIFRESEDIFKAIRKEDILIHLPFYSFSSVNEFTAQAAEDPNVYAIKLTLYRTSGDSPIIKSLIEAAENGKQVTAVVELKARFDEENNIVWARALENAGVHVVYGISGMKTHCKMLLVVRREAKGMKRYLHLSTGNYNPITARIYTDFGLFTCNEDYCSDASLLFNYLTGFSKHTNYNKFIVSPFSMRKKIVSLIDDEIKSHKEFKNGHIIIKVNSLVDDKVINKLYEASSEGVKVDLIVRGICRLKPQVEGLSDNIKVYSIVGRFLEHTRAFYFLNNGNPVLYSGSADIMERNFDRRVEILFPIESKAAKEDIIEILNLYLKDNVKTRLLNPDGTYSRKQIVPDDSNGENAVFNIQEYFIEKLKKKYLEDMRKMHRKKQKKKQKVKLFSIKN
jgi:polyphosphate kinase